jgi:hypothetical protein
MLDLELAPSRVRVAVDPRRIALTVVGVTTVLWAAAVVVAGGSDKFGHLAAGRIRMAMYWEPGGYQFTTYGFDGSPIRISGDDGGSVVTVVGASDAATAVSAAAAVIGLLIPAALGVFALRLLLRLRAAEPFRDAAWKDVAAVGAVLVVLGLGGQLLDWWSRVAVIAEANGLTSFSTSFHFDPMTITVGLMLALVAVVFRYGEQLQRDVDGTV